MCIAIRFSRTRVEAREGAQCGSEISNVVRVQTVALTKRQEAEMEELKMLPFLLELTRMDNNVE